MVLERSSPKKNIVIPQPEQAPKLSAPCIHFWLYPLSPFGVQIVVGTFQQSHGIKNGLDAGTKLGCGALASSFLREQGIRNAIAKAAMLPL